MWVSRLGLDENCLCVLFVCACTDTSDPGHFGPKTVRHYVFGTEMSYFFLPVPKCLWDTLAPVPNCLNILRRGRSVQRTLRHWYRSVSDRSAARSCSCIASPPHVISAPSIVIFRLLLKTYCIPGIRNHTRHSHLTHNAFQ